MIGVIGERDQCMGTRGRRQGVGESAFWSCGADSISAKEEVRAEINFIFMNPFLTANTSIPAIIQDECHQAG